MRTTVSHVSRVTCINSLIRKCVVCVCITICTRTTIYRSTFTVFKYIWKYPEAVCAPLALLAVAVVLAVLVVVVVVHVGMLLLLLLLRNQGAAASRAHTVGTGLAVDLVEANLQRLQVAQGLPELEGVFALHVAGLNQAHCLEGVVVVGGDLVGAVSGGRLALSNADRVALILEVELGAVLEVVGLVLVVDVGVLALATVLPLLFGAALRLGAAIGAGRAEPTVELVQFDLKLSECCVLAGGTRRCAPPPPPPPPSSLRPPPLVVDAS